MADLTIELNQADLAKLNNMLVGFQDIKTRVMAQAYNKTLVNLRKESVKRIDDYLDLKPTRKQSGKIMTSKARIRSDFNLNRAAYAGSSWEVSQVGSSGPLTLSNFAPKSEKNGVSIRQVKSRGRKTIKRAFIQELTGINHVLQRDYASDYRTYKASGKRIKKYPALPRKYREPWRVLYGKRIMDVFENELPTIVPWVTERLLINVQQVVDFLAKR